MRIPRACKTCEIQFEAIKETQFFCSRKCFRKDYYARKKLEEKVERPFPNYNCSSCGRISPLDFDPLKSPLLFEAYTCPFCDDSREERWKERNLPSYKRKQEVIVQVGVYSSVGHALFVARAERMIASLTSSVSSRAGS